MTVLSRSLTDKEMINLFLYTLPTIAYLSWDCKNSRNDERGLPWAHDRTGHSGLLYTCPALGMLLLASQSNLKNVIFQDVTQYCWMQNCFEEVYYPTFKINCTL